MPHYPTGIRPMLLSGAHARTRNALVLWAAALIILLHILSSPSAAQKKRVPAGGRVAVVVDERLGVLRDAPDFSANILRRLGRGRKVSLLSARKGRDGVTFYRVGVTRRTVGWVQAEAFVRPAVAGDDARLWRLIKGSEGFDRIERASIFLEMFPRSPLRPAVLLILGEAAEVEAAGLARAAGRRLEAREMEAGGAPVHTYFLNFNGLDRYRRRGVRFVFDRAAKQYRYEGASWREILRRHPGSPEAAEARRRLDAMNK